MGSMLMCLFLSSSSFSLTIFYSMQFHFNLQTSVTNGWGGMVVLNKTQCQKMNNSPNNILQCCLTHNFWCMIGAENLLYLSTNSSSIVDKFPSAPIKRNPIDGSFFFVFALMVSFTTNNNRRLLFYRPSGLFVWLTLLFHSWYCDDLIMFNSFYFVTLSQNYKLKPYAFVDIASSFVDLYGCECECVSMKEWLFGVVSFLIWYEKNSNKQWSNGMKFYLFLFV